MYDKLPQPSDKPAEAKVLYDLAQLRNNEETAANFVSNNLDRMVEIVNGDNPEQALQAATEIYHSWVNSSDQADPQIVTTFKSLLPKIIADYPIKEADQNLPFAPLAAEFVNDFSYDHISTDVIKRYKKLQEGNVLEAFGCHYSSMKSSWHVGMRPSRRKRDIAEAMQVMSRLESMQPGTVDKIQTTNLLRNFQRYTPEMIYKMHQDQTEHPEQDYVLMIQSVADHNNAFKNPTVYENLYEQLQKKGYGLRIYECNDDRELDIITNEVLNNHDTFGARVASELIAGHGSYKAIEMGGSNTDILHVNNVKDTQHNEIVNAFTTDAEVKLYSCSTGKEPGGNPSIARNLARSMGRTVTAPTIDAEEERKIRAIRNGDGINLMLEYRRRKSKNGNVKFVKTQPARYKN